MDSIKVFGLIGRTLAHSFSATYFNQKFEELGLDAHYKLFELASIKEITELLKTPNLVGLNVTVPYKQAVIPYLTGLADSAREVGAVNTIAKSKSGWIGHNTDMPAFSESLQNFFMDEAFPLPETALILGTGGGSVAVQAALQELDVDYTIVSRKSTSEDTIQYQDITKKMVSKLDLVINTTPLGMYPDVDSKPDLPYHLFTHKTLAFDLVYNPEETAFMQAMQNQGCPVRNGLEMLHLQAEMAWEIWRQLTSKS